MTEVIKYGRRDYGLEASCGQRSMTAVTDIFKAYKNEYHRMRRNGGPRIIIIIIINCLLLFGYLDIIIIYYYVPVCSKKRPYPMQHLDRRCQTFQRGGRERTRTRLRRPRGRPNFYCIDLDWHTLRKQNIIIQHQAICTAIAIKCMCMSKRINNNGINWLSISSA